MAGINPCSSGLNMWMDEHIGKSPFRGVHSAPGSPCLSADNCQLALCLILIIIYNKGFTPTGESLG